MLREKRGPGDRGAIPSVHIPTKRHLRKRSLPALHIDDPKFVQRLLQVVRAPDCALAWEGNRTVTLHVQLVAALDSDLHPYAF